MKKELLDSNPILKLSFDFSIMIIDYCEKLESNKKYILERQLFRSGTFIGANAMEVQNNECKADFIHKMKIASKEAEESQYWLLPCQYSTNYPDCILAQSKLEEVNKVLDKILATSKKKSPSAIC